MKAWPVSEILRGFKRSGLQAHRTVTVLGQDGEIVATSEKSSKIQTVKEYFEMKNYAELLEVYLPFAYRNELIESEDLYLVTRALLTLKRRSEALDLLKLNKEIIIHHRILMFEYIVVCSKEGDFESMSEGITNCETRFGDDAIHSKILQALIQSNSEIERYLEKMNARYKQHAPYEILRAAYATRNAELMRSCLTGLGDDPRHHILALRSLLHLNDHEAVRHLIRKLKPEHFNKPQAREIVRISLQIQIQNVALKWAERADLSSYSMEHELARNQLSSGIKQNDFDLGVEGLKSLLRFEKPTRTQVLRLIRTEQDYQKVFQCFLNISESNGFMLQLILEFAVKYSFREISMEAMERLECLMICDLDSNRFQRHYLEGSKNSGDVNLMRRAYNHLEYISNPCDEVFEYASYFSSLIYELDLEETLPKHLDENAIEYRVLRKIIQNFTSPQPQYIPIKNQTLVVNNSLKFGGAERQVVRCLSNPNFSKSLAVWNKNVNTPENSFIGDVNVLDIDVFDYSINNGDAEVVMTPEIRHLLGTIPVAPPMNPGITNKIEKLVQIILIEKPTTLHLWQDTTNILGAIAGLLCGVPRIVMSARSLPPFNLPNSSFPNKGPNYYYNNRFVRLNYSDLLLDDRVYLCHNSQNGLEKYVEWLGGFSNKMLVLRNGFDLQKFDHTVAQTVTNEAFNIGVVFRFVEVKQPFLWLDVAKNVLRSTENKVRFTMVGDGPLLEDSIERAKTLGIEEYIDFKGYREDVVEILSTFDLFLLTSLIEGLPNVLIEAQAMGVPVVSTDAGGASETFVHGGSGYLVKQPTAEKLSEAILKILSDEEFQNSASVVAMEHVKDHFSLESMHAKLEKILFGGLM
jgi:glycosyltransferase involved in cell wall biosynthesis